MEDFVKVILLFSITYPLFVVSILWVFTWSERQAYMRHHLTKQKLLGTSKSKESYVLTIGVLHPYPNGGGGGERVLYCILEAIVKEFQKLKAKRLKDDDAFKKIQLQILLFASAIQQQEEEEEMKMKDLLEQACKKFNLQTLYKVEPFVKLVVLKNCDELLNPINFPRFTLFFQAKAHVLLTFQAFEKATKELHLYPQIWIDTTGCPFSFVVAFLRYGCKVIPYIHYPMISTDMISNVCQRQETFNNSMEITNSWTKTFFKTIYYRLFAFLYGLVGKYCTHLVLVNSTWTFHHIQKLFFSHSNIQILYPPCGANMKEYHAFSFENKLQNQILSIAQFRPEKNHLLQLKAFQLVLMKWKKTCHVHFSKPKFVILGSCRHEEDFNRAKKLQEICKQMQIDEYVHFVINATYEQLKQYLATSSFGLHTMYNEHFGISIVEMMAAGLIVVANNSGGPAQDIIKPWTGFLALTAEEYATHLLNCFEENPSQILETRKIARNAALRFTDEEFTKDFIHATRPLIFEIFT